MTTISTAGVHHVALTVTDVKRSQQFYTELLGFNHLTDFGPRALLHNGSVLLGLGPAPDPAKVTDHINEHSLGLEHLIVAGIGNLHAATELFNARASPTARPSRWNRSASLCWPSVIWITSKGN